MSLVLPLGTQSDSFRVHLTVKVIDNDFGETTVNLSQSVTVYPNFAKTSELMTDILDGYLNSSLAKTLREYGIKEFGQNLISFASMLNYESSINSSAASLTANSSTGELVKVADAMTNKRSRVRDSMLKLVDTLKPWHLGSIKLISSMAAEITNSVNEVSIESTV